MRDTPYWCLFNTFNQGIVYFAYKYFQEKYLAINYEREVFTLKDGGQLAIEWFEGKPQ